MEALAKNLITFILTCILIFQICKAIETFLSRPTSLSARDVSIVDDELEFPAITVCPDNGYNHSAVELNGYDHVFQFLLGTLKFPWSNTSFLGWGGIENVTFDELAHGIFLGQNVSVEISITDMVETFYFPIEIQKSFIVPYGFCFTAKSSDVKEKIKGMPKRESLYFMIEAPPGNYSILITDPERKLDFKLEENSFTVNGIHFEAKGMEKTKQFYQITVEQQKKNEDDPKADCENYGSSRSKYKSWQECVNQEIEEPFLKYMNCTPPWMNLKQPCQKSPVFLHEVCLPSSVGIFVGNIWLKQALPINTCPDPCNHMTISPKLLRELENTDKEGVTLIFSPSVRIMTYPISYDAFNLLVEVGSAAGLWIGISVLSIAEHGISYTGRLASLLRSRRKM